MANSSEEEKKPILSRRYSTKQKKKKEEFSSSEEDRAVMVRLPRDSTEKTRIDNLNSYLDKNLSALVNSYEIGEFEGEKYSIGEKTGEKIRGALFLDNDRIAVLVEKDTLSGVEFYLNIHNPANGKLIISKPAIRTEPGDTKYRNFGLIITPMRNILITFHVLDTCYIYYFNQDMEKIWHTVRKLGSLNKYQQIPILNDDTVIIRFDKFVTLKSKDREIKWDYSYKTSPPPFEYILYYRNINFIPYGVKGFIAYSTDAIYLYDDNYVENLLVRRVNYKITSVELINKTLFYGTSDNSLTILDLTTNKKVTNVEFGGNKQINKIKALPYNKCLLLCGDSHDSNQIKICDLANLSSEPEKEFTFDGVITYNGIFSNGNIFFFLHAESKELLIYNIKTTDMTMYDLKVIMLKSKFLGISSTDLLLFYTDYMHGRTLHIYG
jgi:hypothetical protein